MRGILPFKRIKIQGHSMEPTIKEGGWLILNQWAYLFRSPKVGDIVIMESHLGKGEFLCKRIRSIKERGTQYEVVGDNPQDSLDSRRFGSIAREQILGKAWSVISVPSSNSHFPTPYPQCGQSLIETIMAVFILTTGLISGLALAIFSFGSSTQIVQRIAGTSLAREGIEGVRRMRDTNWRADILTDCGAQQCYANWLTKVYDIHGSALGDGLLYRLVFDPTALANKWTLVPSGVNDDYRLYIQPNGGLSHNRSFGSPPTNFFRKINIIYSQTTAPYSAISPLVLVRATVWWQGKGCPSVSFVSSPSDTPCKIISEDYLTNWRNY